MAVADFERPLEHRSPFVTTDEEVAQQSVVRGHDEVPVDDGRRRPRSRAIEVEEPFLFARLAVQRQQVALVGHGVQDLFAEGGCRPQPPFGGCILEGEHPPHVCVIALEIRIELDQLALFLCPIEVTLVLHRHVEHSLFVDDDRSVDIVTDPVVEDDRLIGRNSSEDQLDVESDDAPCRVGEIDPALEDRRRVLHAHRRIAAADVVQ